MFFTTEEMNAYITGYDSVRNNLENPYVKNSRMYNLFEEGAKNAVKMNSIINQRQ